MDKNALDYTSKLVIKSDLKFLRNYHKGSREISM